MPRPDHTSRHASPAEPHWGEADRMMRSHLGQQALREGWGGELYRMVLQHGTPTVTDGDVVQLAFAQRQSEKLYRSLESESPHPLRDTLLAIRRQERAFEQILLDHYLGQERGQATGPILPPRRSR